MPPAVRRVLRLAVTFAVYGVLAALLWTPIAVERSIEETRFDDRVGTVPVEITLSHDGRSTLDTGVLGRLYWEQTGAFGFGARLRVTGTPEGGGTLASYVSPEFTRANAAFVSDPAEVARAYGAELQHQFLRGLVVRELLAFLVGGAVLTAIFRARSPLPRSWSPARATAVGAAAVLVAVGASGAGAVWLFQRWEGNGEVGESYAMPGVPGLSFSSPQALEIARQVQPFLEKNNARIEQDTRDYLAALEESLSPALAARSGALAPREGEGIVLAEADPQGSHVGTRVREAIYARLYDELGVESFVLRTISGDVTSNGTVAESGFVGNEAVASGEVPTVAVKGDHDTDTTVGQLDDNDVVNPHFDLTEVAGLRVVAGNDPAFKTLFGGMVVNETGVSESQLGADLRSYVEDEDPDSVLVLVHQPRAAAGYLGLDSPAGLTGTGGSVGSLADLTTPYDDGIPDVPPGVINIGHLHDAAAPRVIWNTDGDEVTWTVVNQLGTSGGVEERPTYNRFSTPYSVPLKTLSVQLQYLDTETGLQVGYASIDVAPDGTATVTDRTDIGLR